MKTAFRTLLTLTLSLCLLCALGVSASAETTNQTVTVKVQDSINITYTFPFTPTSMSIAGSCPGVVFGAVDNGFIATGNPTAVGSYVLQTTATKSDGSADVYNLTIQVIEGDSSGEPAVIVVDDGQNKEVVGDGKVTITKHPTGETVAPGGTAKFKARADNATEIVWRLVSADTTITYTAKEAPNYFAGLTVEGLGTETLILHGIPYSLDGWCVEAMFKGEGGPVFSYGARIRVTGGTPATPRISVQPKGAQLQNGQTTTLSVTAATAEGTLNYQWYRNDDDENSGGSAISGATGPSYTPVESAGISYYYVNVWSSLDGQQSTHVNSAVAAVQYPAAQPAQTTPAGQTGGETTQSGQTDGQIVEGTQSGQSQQPTGTQTGTQTASPSGQPRSGSANQAVVTTAEPNTMPENQRSHTGIIVLILILSAVLLAACVSLYFLKRSQSDE